MADGATSAHRRAVIGNEKSFWIYDSDTGFDLTHPETPDSPAIDPSLTIQTTTSPITIDPAKSALVIIDMQNYFLSPAFGRSPGGAGHKASTSLLSHAIPAARKSRTRIVWLNWGLTDDDLAAMPAAVSRAFGFEAWVDGKGEAVPVDKYGGVRYPGGGKLLKGGGGGRKFAGLGAETGVVVDGEGREVEGGRLLCRGSWNAALYSELAEAFDAARGDVWVHKNRMSGLWGSGTELERVLEGMGVRTLLFAGVNTDQCVGGTYQDAFSKGYDCILLSDGCGTTSPASAQECIEHNAANTWGFLTTCKDFADAAVGMEEQ